mmetsp:Transcript_9744/g.34264  ORF Transcript_9744/g.34264 Transcript_9744/m.34264 type:complete len:237 (-) Transcript_9744:16-726(-)
MAFLRLFARPRPGRIRALGGLDRAESGVYDAHDEDRPRRRRCGHGPTATRRNRQHVERGGHAGLAAPRRLLCCQGRRRGLFQVAGRGAGAARHPRPGADAPLGDDQVGQDPQDFAVRPVAEDVRLRRSGRDWPQAGHVTVLGACAPALARRLPPRRRLRRNRLQHAPRHPQAGPEEGKGKGRRHGQEGAVTRDRPLSPGRRRGRRASRAPRSNSKFRKRPRWRPSRLPLYFYAPNM